MLDGGTYTMGRRAEIAQTLVCTKVCTRAVVAMVTVAAGTLLCK